MPQSLEPLPHNYPGHFGDDFGNGWLQYELWELQTYCDLGKCCFPEECDNPMWWDQYLLCNEIP